MLPYLLVAAGAAVGAPLRYLSDRAVQSRHSSPFPWGTLTVNLVGSLILGIVTGATLDGGGNLRLLIGTGFCGALTTYSTLSYETVRLFEKGERTASMANMVVTVFVGIGAAALGFWLGQAF